MKINHTERIQMKHRNTLARLILSILLLAPLAVLHAADVANLRCEYRENPLGIDLPKPRLSWIIESTDRGERQTAYQVLVASSEKLLKKDKGDLWDSGKVESDQSVHVKYAGKPLESRMPCYWKVRVWTVDSGFRVRGSGWSKPALWSMGLLKPEDWSAKWIGNDKAPANSFSQLSQAQWIWYPEGEPAASALAGVRYFRRAFALPADRKMVRASVQLTADNAFELVVNGKSAGRGDNFTVPVTIDITGLLQGGSNTLAVAATNVGETPNPAGLIAALKVEFAEGAPLQICTDAQWKANVLKVAGWEQTGFDDAVWVPAKALGANGMSPWGNIGTVDARPLSARYLRREFAVEKKVVRATAYVCGLGFFDLYVNGKKVSDQIMNPALSDYRKAAYYVTFDITDQLKDGANALGVALGNGRFFAPRLTTPAATLDYGYPKLLLQAEIQYTDGSTQRIVSDENWTLTTAGPIRANSEYDGEEYDARMEMPGWCQPRFDDTKWEKAALVSAPGGMLLAQMIEPMRVTQVIKPVGITNPKPGTYIVDMGQNFYGAVRLKAKAPAGTEVRMVSAYSLLPDGMLKTADNRGAKATDVYVFKGKGEEIWTPQFKGQGFRRVQVTGFSGTPTVDNFEGLVINTDARPVGEFACSNELVNRIHRALWWGMRMFLRSAPLDPDRDERQAWMGDPAKDSESEAFNFNVAPFYTKWMDDVRRSQRVDGTIPDVSMNWEWNGNVEWPSVFTIIPDWFLDFYADQNVVETQYEAMKRWVQAMKQNKLAADGTLKEGPYGDWCDTYTMDGKKTDNGNTPQDLIATAYHYNNCRIMARAAKLLKKPEDEKLFGEWADQLKLAFNKKFLNPTTGVYLGGTQCAYVLPLAFGLVPDECRQKVIDNLVNDILVTHKGHLSVGLIGMQWLMQVLTDIGRPDVAWTIVTQTTRPSWGYMISKGATTIWERWDCDTRDPGMNSEALLIQAGNLDAWFYQTLAGINYDRENPGFKHIIIRPQPSGDLTWVKAHYDSSYGRIVSNWKREGDKLTMEVIIPANTSATVYVPVKDAAGVTESGKPADKAEGVKLLRMENNAAVYAVGSGTYNFKVGP